MSFNSLFHFLAEKRSQCPNHFSGKKICDFVQQIRAFSLSPTIRRWARQIEEKDMYEVVSLEKQILVMICREENCGRLVTRSAVFILCLSLCRRWLQRCSDSSPCGAGTCRKSSAFARASRFNLSQRNSDLMRASGDERRDKNCNCLVIRFAVGSVCPSLCRSWL